MFKTSQPVDEDALKHGICENPRTERGSDAKTIAKVKDRATKPLELKFGLPYYYLLGKFGEDNDNNSKNLASHNALIGVCHTRGPISREPLLFGTIESYRQWTSLVNARVCHILKVSINYFTSIIHMDSYVR